MAKLLKIENNNEYIMLEFLFCNNIQISTRVYNTDLLTAQEIVNIGFNSLKPHIDVECIRLQIETDDIIPVAEDYVERIEILGIGDMFLTDSILPYSFNLRCVGYTKYGKVESLTESATFNSTFGVINRNILTIESLSSDSNIKVGAEYNGLISFRDVFFNYKINEEIENHSIQEEPIQEDAVNTQIELSLEEKISELQQLVADLISLNLGV